MDASNSQIGQVSHASRGAMHEDLIDFLDVTLRPAAGFSIRKEYPALFGEYPGGESFVLRVEGELASHVGFVVREFQHTKYRMRIGLIGSVVTAPQFRSMGFAKKLLEQALRELKRRGCLICVLWWQSPPPPNASCLRAKVCADDARPELRMVGDGFCDTYDAFREQASVLL